MIYDFDNVQFGQSLVNKTNSSVAIIGARNITQKAQ